MRALAERHVVLTVGLEAAQAAAASHDPQKRRYLANAVVNVIAEDAWDVQADFAETLIRIVATLTATHIRLLALLIDPEGWQEEREIDLRDRVSAHDDGRWHIRDLVVAAFPDLGQAAALVPGVLGDLESRGLLAGLGYASESASVPVVDDLLAPDESSFGLAVLRFGLRRCDGRSECGIAKLVSRHPVLPR